MRFGPFALNPATGELTRNDYRMTLRPQAAHVLTFLAGRAGQLVTREELCKELWGGDTYVDFEHGVNLCIHEIRNALHDDSTSPTYVETFPRRGYRFIAPVEWDAATIVPPMPAAERSDAVVVESANGDATPKFRYFARRVAVILGFAAIVGITVIVSSNSSTQQAAANPAAEPYAPTVALLTLNELGGSPGEKYFADGVSWELQRQLEGESALRIAARRSVVPYDGTKNPAAAIGRELNVSAVASGSVLRTGERILLNVKLAEAKSGAILWAESYDTSLAGLLQTEARIARAIAHALVPGTVASPARAPAGQVNAAAHELLLKAMGADSQAELTRGLEKALALDPNFELAWSLYSGVELSDTWFAQTNSPMDGYPKAKEAALKALSLDETDAYAHTTLAAVKLHHEWDWAGAEREFRRAIQLSPSNANAHHIYSHYLLTMDRLNESVAESRTASELNPLDPNLSTCVGWHCLYARQYEDAIAACMKLIHDEKAGAITYYYLGRVYVRQGKFAEGVAALEIAEKKSGGINSVLATLAYAYARSGRRADAERALAALMDRAQRRYVSAFDIAIVYAGLGETDKTFEWLDRAFLERSTWLVHLKWDDRFTSIRSDPRTVTLLRRMGIPNPESVRKPEATVEARYISPDPVTP